MRTGLPAGLAVALATSLALAADASPLDVARAWSPASPAGADVPVFMAIANEGATPDELLRARCSAAFFLEKRTTDYGEGAPAGREVKVIAVPAGQTTTLAPGGLHLMLLRTKQPLAPGDRFSCSLSFKVAGTREVGVTVAAAEGPL